MKINTQNLVSITEANQNFSRIAHLADTAGPVVILQDDAPKYLLIDFASAEGAQYAADEDVLSISRRLIAKNRRAYEELAK